MSKPQSEIKLRPIRAEDAEVLMALNNDKQIADCVVGNPTVVTMEQQIKWIERLSEEKNIMRWTICFGDKAVGTIFLSGIDIVNSVGNVNIKILPSYQGKGIAKEALSMLCDIAFDELHLSCLTANVLSYNTKSKMLFENSGFQIDGILRSRVIKNEKRCDLIALSLLKEERIRE